MRDARSEGRNAASVATPTTRTTTPASVSGSEGLTPKSRPDSARPNANESTRPTTHATPTTRNACVTNCATIAPERAERHAQADLAPAQAHDVAQRAVEAEARERERRAGEQREHRGAQAILRVRVADLLVERADREHRAQGLELPHLRSDGCNERFRVGAGANEDVWRRRADYVAEVHRRRRWLVQATLTDVPDDPRNRRALRQLSAR